MHPIGRSGYLSAERIAAELLVRTRSLSGAAVAAQQPTATGIDADENDVVELQGDVVELRQPMAA